MGSTDHHPESINERLASAFAASKCMLGFHDWGPWRTYSVATVPMVYNVRRIRVCYGCRKSEIEWSVQ